MPTWLPGFQRRDLGPDGGAFDVRRNPKVLLHTTEGSTLGAAENAYRNYPPHVGVDPDRRIRRQYVRLDRHSYSLAGGESDDEYVIQVEIVGFAGQTHRWSDAMLRWLGEHVLRPIMAAVDCPPRIPRAGFKGEGSGIVLASPNSPIRFSLAEFRRFSGVCGHQHAPAPDSHWDPGALNVRRIIDYAYEEDDMSWNEDLSQWAPGGYDQPGDMPAGQQLNQARGYSEAAWRDLRKGVNLHARAIERKDVEADAPPVSMAWVLQELLRRTHAIAGKLDVPVVEVDEEELAEHLLPGLLAAYSPEEIAQAVAEALPEYRLVPVEE